MSKEIILSIAIPTYNRVKFLETTVNTFVSQIRAGGFENEVEIVIGNDASPDDSTAEYLERLDQQYSFIHTITHKKNLGVSANIEKIFDLAKGEFIWGFGDDDLITEKALEKVIASIKNDKPNLILLNTINFTSHDDRNLDYKIWDKNRLDIKTDIFVDSFEDEKYKLAAVSKWFYLTNLISTVIFRKEMFVAELPEAKKYLRPENVYLFQAPLIIGIAKWGRLKLIAQQMVLHRKNENHWSAKTEGLLRINMYDASEAVRLVKDYLPSEYKSYQKIFAVHTFTAIKKAIQKGESVNHFAYDAIKKYYSCFPYSIRFVIALIIPKAILRYFIQS